MVNSIEGFFRSTNTTKLNNFLSMFMYKSFVQSSIELRQLNEIFLNHIEVQRVSCLQSNIHKVEYVTALHNFTNGRQGRNWSIISFVKVVFKMAFC